MKKEVPNYHEHNKANRALFIRKAVESDADKVISLWYIPDEEGGLKAVASTYKTLVGEIKILFLGSLGDNLGLQLLKSIAEYAKENNTKVLVFPAEQSEQYYLRLGFKPVVQGQKTLYINPEDLLNHPDYFE